MSAGPPDDLETDYEAAWSEWEKSGEVGPWEATTSDGLDDDPGPSSSTAARQGS